MARATIAWVLLLLSLPSVALAQAEKRVALLIGNQAYTPEIGALVNPHNDVALLERTLTTLGFQVTTVRDADLATLTRAVNAYTRRLAVGQNAVGFFYYSGHGAADGGTNYLIPTDVRTTETGELWDQSLRLTEITRKLRSEAGSATHFVVFDACRNTLKLRKPGTRALVQSKGFVPVMQENGMLIAYATAEGELASDVGDGAGPYARVLADEMVKPGVEAVTMFRRVQVRVRSSIGQEPWLGFSALGEVHFAGVTTEAANNSQDEAERTWQLVKDSTDPSVLQAYLKQFGDGIYAALARSRLNVLEKERISSADPPKPSVSQDAAQQAPISLKIAHWLPPSHPLHKAFEEWGASLAKASDGTINAQIFDAQKLGKAPDHYDMASSAVADVAFVNPGYQPGRFPIIAAGELPLLVANAKGGSQALDGWYRKYAAREMKGVKYCFALMHDPGTLHSRSKKVLVPSDLKGMKIRPPNAGMAALVTQLGGINVQVSAPEILGALEKGATDAVMFPWGSVLMFGIDKVAKYHIDAPFYSTVFSWVMNKSTFERMSPLQKKTIDEHCSEQWAMRVAGSWADVERAGLDRLKADRMHDVYRLSPEQLIQWRKAIAPLQTAWAEGVRKVGEDPTVILEELKAALTKHGAVY
jgi:TRAP-type C4-dicarboxylate transport system substrate-binding protein/uncharacterized caspase-like protein